MKSSQHRYRLPLLGALFLVPLAWGSAAPARADIFVNGSNSSSAIPYVINGTVNESVWVAANGFLNIQPGANISANFALIVDGGTVNVSGGTISGSDTGIEVSPNGGTLNVTGGTISGGNSGNKIGVFVLAGTANLTGGMISGTYGVAVHNGTVDVAGSAISASSQGIEAQGGTVNVSAGTAAGDTGIVVEADFSSVTVNLSGGAVSGGSYGLRVASGTVNLSGGSVSGGIYGVAYMGGTLSISGCCVQLSGGQLTGTLQDGTAINTPTSGVTASNLVSTCTGNLSLSIDTMPSPAVSSGSNLTYTIVVGYTGPAAEAQNVTLTDPLPAGASFVSASATAGTLTKPKGKNSTLSWNIATLGNGDSATLTLVVTMRAKAGTTLSNTASVSSACPSASNSTTVSNTVQKR